MNSLLQLKSTEFSNIVAVNYDNDDDDDDDDDEEDYNGDDGDDDKRMMTTVNESILFTVY